MQVSIQSMPGLDIGSITSPTFSSPLLEVGCPWSRPALIRPNSVVWEKIFGKELGWRMWSSPYSLHLGSALKTRLKLSFKLSFWSSPELHNRKAGTQSCIALSLTSMCWLELSLHHCYEMHCWSGLSADPGDCPWTSSAPLAWILWVCTRGVKVLPHCHPQLLATLAVPGHLILLWYK